MISIKSIQLSVVGSRANKPLRMSNLATLWHQIQLLWILSKRNSLQNAKLTKILFSHTNTGPIKIWCLEHYQRTFKINLSKYRVKEVHSHKLMIAKIGVREITRESSIPRYVQNIYFTLHPAKRKVNYSLLTFHRTFRLLAGIRLGNCNHQINTTI